MFDALDSTGQCASADQQDYQHNKGTCGREVDHLLARSDPCIIQLSASQEKPSHFTFAATEEYTEPGNEQADNQLWTERTSLLDARR